MKGEITVAAGRLQGQHDAMATTSISILISSLLFHLSLLNPEAGNVLIWKEHKMAGGCYAYSNSSLPNGPVIEETVSSSQKLRHPGPPTAFVPDVATQSRSPGRESLPAACQPAACPEPHPHRLPGLAPRGFWEECADRGGLADTLGDLL